MKYLSASLVILLSFSCFTLNAQVFVGGNVGFNTSNHKTGPEPKTSAYNLGLSPTIGKFLSDKIAIGVALDMTFTGSSSDQIPKISSSASSVGGSFFMRYYAIKWNKFSVFEQGNIGVDVSSSSDKSNGIITDGPKTTQLFIGAYPGLAYDISDRLSLQTYIKVLSLNYNYSKATLNSNKSTSSYFSFGAGLDNIVSLNAITIGAIYKFK